MNAEARPLSRLELGDVPAGSGLVRPECVLATRSGDVFTADWRGGVAHLARRWPPSAVSRVRTRRPRAQAQRHCTAARRLVPGHASGCQAKVVYSTSPAAARSGRGCLASTASICRRRTSCCWMRRAAPGSRSARGSSRARWATAAAAMTASSCAWTRAVRASPPMAWATPTKWPCTRAASGSTSTRHLRRRLSRFPLHADGSLGAKQVVTEFGPGSFPDGLAFDEEGHAWVVSIVSNRLIRVAPDGSQTRLARGRRARAPGLGRSGL